LTSPFSDILEMRFLVTYEFYVVFGSYLGVCFFITSFFRGYRLQFHCCHGVWGIYYNRVF